MTIIQKIIVLFKKNINFSSIFDAKTLRFQKFNFLIVISFLIFFSALFFISSNILTKVNNDNRKNFKEITATNEFQNLTNFLISKINSPYNEINYVIEENDTIQKILKKFKLSNDEINEITKKLKEKKQANIYPGRKLSLVLKRLDNGSNTLVNFIYPVNNTTSVEIRKSKENYDVKENILQLYKNEVVVKNIINNNLYKSATESGIEPNIIIEFARIFGFEVDFQRDIRKGDWFEILYEKFVDDNGKVRDTGKIIYASMYVNGEEINLYNFKFNKDEDFYDIKGKSITKSLMKTPINGARLSSSFGMRKHPILGYNKMHKGTDFAAPSGTPIMASGSGTITRARWCGGGGNCIKIKHNSTYETIYAHMKAFAKGIREGKKVKQGQIIGYVGSTGLSTGPHLHYEVLINGKKVNSQKLKLPSGKILRGEERKKFEIDRIMIDLRLASLR
tara:strand:+ start:201 stop:1547 length:1347 start_codon:yes stop_codon:yes gene_type:complete